jgi:hypothetical protein
MPGFIDLTTYRSGDYDNNTVETSNRPPVSITHSSNDETDIPMEASSSAWAQVADPVNPEAEAAGSVAPPSMSPQTKSNSGNGQRSPRRPRPNRVVKPKKIVPSQSSKITDYFAKAT